MKDKKMVRQQLNGGYLIYGKNVAIHFNSFHINFFNIILRFSVIRIFISLLCSKTTFYQTTSNQLLYGSRKHPYFSHEKF